MIWQGNISALSFIRELRNITVVYKPNSYIYLLCEVDNNPLLNRIRWHYESDKNDLIENINENEIDDFYSTTSYLNCKRILNNSDCFEFYYSTTENMSLLVVKEPDVYKGTYSCRINMNSTYELKSHGFIDIKQPLKDIDDNEDVLTMFNENELSNLAMRHQVPFILDESDTASFGKRIQIDGTFHTKCESINSKNAIEFLWIHLKNRTISKENRLTTQQEETKIIRIVQPDRRVRIQSSRNTSHLYIYPVRDEDDGDYVCIASNKFGMSFSSIRPLIVTERMVLPRIRNLENNSHVEMHEDNNDVTKLICIGEGYPEPQIVWIRVSDSIHITSNRSRAVLELKSESHGLNKYVCQAKNQHGLAQIFITVTIPDATSKPTLSYTDLQAKSIVLRWRMSNDKYNRFNHFIVVNLIPFTKYEFRVRGFTGPVPSSYSNPVVIQTSEAVPNKVEWINGYAYNSSAVVVYWKPINSTNGPNFRYIIHYTTNISTAFYEWQNVTVHTYSIYVLTNITFKANMAKTLVLCIASVNAKGSILSGFHIVNLTSFYTEMSSTIENFHCPYATPSLSSSTTEVLLKWKIPSSLIIERYILYYFDFSEQSINRIAQTFIIPSSNVINNQNNIQYVLNTSLLNLNTKTHYILSLNMAIMDDRKYQSPMSEPTIYCLTATNEWKEC
ncbi:unnamed protein product [Didymodactylos carnosus]|uniref:Uncharacterized protein n=1 Tax=Didymodactylos carnosus TaxID=1234261 RepID=A0A8S2HHY5_9BILA|nr:unnamed protein product [Didymodactylos carnosus]CAF3652072.1 unnamed protein product [Didymodactylos carnosus]